MPEVKHQNQVCLTILESPLFPGYSCHNFNQPGKNIFAFLATFSSEFEHL